MWCSDVLTTARMDPWFVVAWLLCVVGNHAMLHYLNGLTLGKEEEEEEGEGEKKEKMD